MSHRLALEQLCSAYPTSNSCSYGVHGYESWRYCQYLVHPKSAAPKYKFAAKFNLALNCIILVGISINILVLRWRNRAKIEKRGEILAGLKELNDKEQYEILGDRHPDFKYTL